MKNNQTQVLESVAVKGHLRGLCLELEVVQAFVNSSDHNIEAIYTFPLPFGAVLLDLTVKLGDKVLSGAVMAKKQAERNYENAITDGNSAIMLERADDGICTINVGNLLAGERAELRYRFSQLLNWQQDSLRITLPTTMAPRYGDPLKAGWQPHQVTEHSLLAEYPFSLALDIEHPLSNAMLECPSHTVSITRKEEITNVTLSGKQAWLDRDFILNISQQNTDKDAGQFSLDGEGFVALASFYPKIPSAPISSACIKVVVDCSGSMAGDSINQAKLGLLRILDNLRESDTFNIVRFGDSARAYFPKCVKATKTALNQAREAIQTMDADLGGTEMANALKFAYALKDEGDRPASILLITDGEVYEHEDIVRNAKKSKHRIFTVGVGNSVAESFVRNIATSTGGATELVSPNEEMAATIFRQFNRMFQQRAISAEVQWPNKPLWQSPKTISNVFAGDTLHLFAGFNEQPLGQASLKLALEDGQTVEQQITLQLQAEASQDLARIAVAHHIELMSSDKSETQATALAVEYQLISKYTNFLIIEERAEEVKPTDLPEVAQVPHMMAAGYGGTGRAYAPQISYSFKDMDDTPTVLYSRSRSGQVDEMKMSGVEEFDIPAFLRKHTDDYPPAESPESSMIDNIIGSIKDAFTPKVKTPIAAVVAVVESNNWYKAYQDNVYGCLSNELIEVIDTLINEHGWAEKTVVAAMLMAMLQQLDKVIPKHDMRALLLALKAESPPNTLIDCFVDGVNLKNKNWGWHSAIELLPIPLIA
jgi:Ca-activated chloride channel family protein